LADLEKNKSLTPVEKNKSGRGQAADL
jgi:hypothetical protein